jgi:glucose-1-phosphate cytidylyltransferase
MKVAILAGGHGTRISEESSLKPKPMIEIGGRPILWHIMKLYSYYGHKEFVILCGYKGYVIKEYFANYFLHQSDVTFDTSSGRMEIHNNASENWKVTLLDTGISTMTGGRLKRAKEFLDGETFMLTYGDGVSNVNLDELLKYHTRHKKLMTLTSVQPEGRFGALDLGEEGHVKSFLEKPKGDGAWINGGYFVCEPGIFDYIQDDETYLEKEPLEKLSKDCNLVAFRHQGFWKPMDTLRDKKQLVDLWESGAAKWKVWN